jgi:hypothetical protein
MLAHFQIPIGPVRSENKNCLTQTDSRPTGESYTSAHATVIRAGAVVAGPGGLQIEQPLGREIKVNEQKSRRSLNCVKLGVRPPLLSGKSRLDPGRDCAQLCSLRAGCEETLA